MSATESGAAQAAGDARPPQTPQASRLEWLARRARLGPTGRFSPFIVRAYQGWAGTILRLGFRPELKGIERLPVGRPYLLVSNHSGGGATEICALLMLWVRAFGAERPISGMAHPFFFSVPIAGHLLAEVGAIPSTYEAALAALAQGVPVLVFPGGDHDSFRPIWQAGRVDFNQRKGFLKIARRAWVPIVPMAIRGSHYTLPILWRSRFLLPYGLVLPALIGLKRFPLTLSGLIGAALSIGLLGPLYGLPIAALIAWFWLMSPGATLMPILPWTIRAQLGVPIEPAELFGERSETGPLEPAYDRVLSAIQQLLDAPG